MGGWGGGGGGGGGVDGEEAGGREPNRFMDFALSLNFSTANTEFYGISRLYDMHEIYHSDPEPPLCSC